MPIGQVIPTLRYRKALSMLQWLGEAFDFQPHRVIEGPNNTLIHAQLTSNGAMIMIGSAGDGDFDALQKPPTSEHPVVTQSPYIIVADADAHHARALAAGAKIAEPLQSPDHGGRFYSCFDPEGHLWNFGTYDPWQDE